MEPTAHQHRHGPTTPAVARVREPRLIPDLLERSLLGVGKRPVLIILGGAANMTSTEMDAARPLFVALAQLCEREGAAILDGGTDGGVMRLAGEARWRTNSSFPLIGIAPEELITVPGTPPRLGQFEVEPHHTHLFVIPGSKWGDESPWIPRIALSLAGGHGLAAVVVGGGEVSLKDVEEAVGAGVSVIAIADSGRTASRLAQVSEDGIDVIARKVVGTGLVLCIFGIDDPATVIRAIEGLWSSPSVLGP